VQVARRVIEPPLPPARVNPPSPAATPANATTVKGLRRMGAVPRERAWFAAGIAWIAVLGLLAGFAASLLALR
jgi:hypothetical protein